jgi:hypothetical protein
MEEMTGIYELLDALREVIKAADPNKREKLAAVLDAYADDFAHDFFWATGAQSPTLLSNLLMTIDASCRPDQQSKPRGVIRLVDRWGKRIVKASEKFDACFVVRDHNGQKLAYVYFEDEPGA